MSKRKAPHGGKAGSGQAAKSAAADDGPLESELSVLLNDKPVRIARVYEYMGIPLVDIREMYPNSEGQLRPSKKGISLRLEQFRKLVGAAEEIEAAMARLAASTAAEAPADSAGGGDDGGAAPNDGGLDAALDL